MVVSLAMHAAFLVVLTHSQVGDALRIDVDTPAILSARLVRNDVSVAVDSSTVEGAAPENLLNAEQTALAVSESGRAGSAADGEDSREDQRPAQAASSSAGETPSATVTREVSPTYYAADVLGRRPIPLHPVVPKYPEGAEGADGLSGKVRLVLFINENGGVDHASVLSSDLPAAFEMESVTAFSATRYAPGLIADKPVKARFVVEVAFDLSREAIVSRQK